MSNKTQISDPHSTKKPSTLSFSVLERLFPKKEELDEFIARYRGEAKNRSGGWIWTPTELDWKFFDEVNDYTGEGSDSLSFVIRQVQKSMKYSNQTKHYNLAPRYGRMAFLEAHGLRSKYTRDRNQMPPSRRS